MEARWNQRYKRAELWVEIGIVVHTVLKRGNGLFLPQGVAFLKLQGCYSKRQMSLLVVLENHSKDLITLCIFYAVVLNVLLPIPCRFSYSCSFWYEAEVLLNEKQCACGKPDSV